MKLTNAQLLTLKQWIVDNNSSRFDESAVAALNAAASPAFQIYRTSVPMSEIMLNGFDWTRVDNLSVGKARIWEWMVTADPVNRSIDPSKSNIRAGINATWVGTAADLAVRAAVYDHCHRAATVFEKLFATGAGTAPAADGSGPATPGADADGNDIVGSVNLQTVILSDSAS